MREGRRVQAAPVVLRVGSRIASRLSTAECWRPLGPSLMARSRLSVVRRANAAPARVVRRRSDAPRRAGTQVIVPVLNTSAPERTV